MMSLDQSDQVTNCKNTDIKTWKDLDSITYIFNELIIRQH